VGAEIVAASAAELNKPMAKTLQKNKVMRIRFVALSCIRGLLREEED
jgi:hypothetical protein